MLRQILKDMYIEPELLEELSDEQKQILFFKLREEQIRRWKEIDEKQLQEEKLKPRIKKKSAKSVHFLCDDEDKVLVSIMTDEDEVDAGDLRKKQEAAALKRAEEQAHKEAEEKRKKELLEIQARRAEEEKRVKEEEERLKKEREKRQAELRKQEEEGRLKSIKEAQMQKEKAERENREMERKRVEEEAKRKKQMEEIRLREEAEKKIQEQKLLEQETKRKKELYEKMKKEQEEKQKKEEEEAKAMEDQWKEREKKAKEAEEQRRSSFSQTRTEMERIRRLSHEKAALNKFRVENNKMDEKDEEKKQEKEKARNRVSAALSNAPSSTFAGTYSKRGQLSPKRPPLPLRPTISTPVNVTTSHVRTNTVPVKRDIVKPNRPPPIPNIANNSQSSVAGKPKPSRPPRPKNRSEVASWWREVEYDRCSGLSNDKKPLEWFHGIITRQQTEKLLENKQKGSYLVRVSERVWGYTVSFKDVARCKHFLIDTSIKGYQFFGTEQRVHNSLNELVDFHKSNPVSVLGQEILLYPCGQEGSKADYADLFEESTAI